jgi:hypothetical protein
MRTDDRFLAGRGRIDRLAQFWEKKAESNLKHDDKHNQVN